MTTDDNTYPTASQMAELDAALDALAEGRSYRPTLNGLIRGWREIVEQIEAGYDWSVYEYFNDLHVRAMLQSVIDGAPAVRRMGRSGNRTAGRALSSRDAISGERRPPRASPAVPRAGVGR